MVAVPGVGAAVHAKNQLNRQDLSIASLPGSFNASRLERCKQPTSLLGSWLGKVSAHRPDLTIMTSTIPARFLFELLRAGLSHELHDEIVLNLKAVGRDSLRRYIGRVSF
jgi:hypothetical protein